MVSEIRLAGGAGEYMDSAVIVSWTVEPGAPVRAGEVVAVVETAKAATEIEADRDGVLLRILAPVGAEVEIGSVLGLIGEPGDGADAGLSPISGPAASPAPAGREPPDAAARRAASPLARKLARQAGLVLDGVIGSGPGGRIKARDVGTALAEGSRARAREHVVATMRTGSSAAASAGVPIVLIHGFGANRGSWNSLRASLGEECPCLTFDLPGHGRAPRAEIASLEQLAASVGAELEAAKVERCHLVGHSLGGAVAALLAESPDLRVGSLTLIAPAGLGPDIDGRFLDGFLRARSADSLTPWLERLVADRASLPPSFCEAALRERSRPDLLPAQADIAGRLFPDGTQAITIRACLGRLTMPVTVIWGREDRIVPVSHAADLPGHVALHRLPGTGHMPHVEAPELTARLVMRTVRSARPASPDERR